ncbi:LysM-like peptidoglycan-binding domain-containing protein [Erwinia psidii]|nr:LysM-like peptidoglycan-binding domain-containing protein [Erwinia psidii]
MPSAPLTERIALWFHKIWLLPDAARWMDPLPSFHRRGIIVAVSVIVLAFLWPSATHEQRQPVINSSRPAISTPPMQAELRDQQGTTRQQAIPRATDGDSQGQWHSYQIASGQTLAQLFRDHNLAVNDVFAMAQGEGNDKPLSNLQSGQTVKIRQNEQGVVTGLTVDGVNGQILFTRQSDGTFLRAH